MTIDHETDLNRAQAEAFMREQVESALSEFKHKPDTPGTRATIDRVVRELLARLAARGESPPDYWLCHTSATEEECARGVVDTYVVRNFAAYPMTADEFAEMFGRAPEQDDLHRVNCYVAGEFGHYQCGWCMEHRTARFACGCVSDNDASAARGRVSGADPRAPSLSLPDGFTPRALVPSQTFYAPRVAGGERVVFSAADVAAVHAEGEIETDLAMHLTAGFAHGALRAARLLAVLPENASPEHGALVTSEQVRVFVHRRFPDAVEVSVDPRYDSLTIRVTVTTRLEGDARTDLVDRIYAAASPHVAIGVACEVYALPVQAL